MNIVEEKWPEIIEKLKVEYCLTNISYTTWILPMKIYNVTDNIVFISVNLKGSIEHVKYKYSLPLKVCIAEVTGIEYEIEFVSEDELPDEQEDLHIPTHPEESEKTKSVKRRRKTIIEKANLNPKYTFDTFVVGNNNNFAHLCIFGSSRITGKSL